MSTIRLTLYVTARTAVVAPLIGALSFPENAQANVWKECGAQFQEAKAGNRLDGRNWRQFVESCHVQVKTRPTAVAANDANAQTSILKVCGTQYRAAKAADELRGQSWVDFLKACRSRAAGDPPLVSNRATAPVSVPPAAGPAPAPASSPADASAISAVSGSSSIEETKTTATVPTHSDGSEAPVLKSAGQSLMSEKFRQKKCAAQWKTQKADLKKADPTLNWSRYWSECDRRLKVSGQ